jgi:F-type H+-transporting ATPase subunit b
VHSPLPASATLPPCEIWRNPARRVLARLAVCVSLACIAAVSSGTALLAADAVSHTSVAAAAQPAHEAPVSQPAVAEGHTGEEQHGDSPWAFAGKIFNFAVLVGVLVYLLREPVRVYVANRGTQIRTDLVTAAAMKDEATRQMAEIDQKLKQLPAELDRLRAGGQQEIAAEQARIEQAAAAESDRLLQQTRREIELQLRGVRRDLVAHAADLAVQVARERIRSRITTDDQRRLLDRYLEQVSTRG